MPRVQFSIDWPLVAHFFWPLLRTSISQIETLVYRSLAIIKYYAVCVCVVCVVCAHMSELNPYHERDENQYVSIKMRKLVFRSNASGEIVNGKSRPHTMLPPKVPMHPSRIIHMIESAIVSDSLVNYITTLLSIENASKVRCAQNLRSSKKSDHCSHWWIVFLL